MLEAPLPIDPLLGEIVASVVSKGAVVLSAPPGAGKTTRVPRALLADGGIVGDIVVLEPRRLAARVAARLRVAEELGEPVGERVGFQTRFERAISKATRIRFVTEGILGRRLLSDPQLVGTGVVVLDEVHERHLATDIALGHLARLRATSRPDLRIVAMSATLDVAPLARFLGAEIIASEGRGLRSRSSTSNERTRDRSRCRWPSRSMPSCGAKAKVTSSCSCRALARYAPRPPHARRLRAAKR